MAPGGPPARHEWASPTVCVLQASGLGVGGSGSDCVMTSAPADEQAAPGGTGLEAMDRRDPGRSLAAMTLYLN